MTELAKIIEAILFVSGEPVQLGAVKILGKAVKVEFDLK